MSDTPIIRAENLCHVYGAGLPNANVALDNVSFEVPEHSFLGLIGPTGCGKSTLISHFNGLAKPSSGRIFIAGEDPWENPGKIRKFRFLCGLVFQYPEYQLFEETVAADIGYGPRNMGLGAAEVKERVAQAAAFCGIAPELLGRSPFELSGGQKRRVAIAGVLAMRPRLLVLDEPASGLDPAGRTLILSQIKAYHARTRTSVVLVSHSMEDVARYAQRVLVMKEGGVAMYDEMAKVFARAPELVSLGLAVPQVTKIFLRLRELGLDIPTDIYTLGYAADTVLNYAREHGVGFGPPAAGGAAPGGAAAANRQKAAQAGHMAPNAAPAGGAAVCVAPPVGGAAAANRQDDVPAERGAAAAPAAAAQTAPVAAANKNKGRRADAP